MENIEVITIFLSLIFLMIFFTIIIVRDGKLSKLIKEKEILEIIIFGVIDSIRYGSESKEEIIKEILDDTKNYEIREKMLKLSSKKGISKEKFKLEFIKIIEKYFDEFI